MRAGESEALCDRTYSGTGPMDDRQEDIGVPHQTQARASAASASGAVLPRALSLCHASGAAVCGVINE